MRKIRAFIQIIRPELPAAAGVCVVVGQAVALGHLPALGLLLLGFALGFLLSSSAMVFNDYFDLEVDRVNAPRRPLPAGLLTPAEAVVFGLLTALVGLGVALWLSPLVFFLSLLTWILGFLYNWKLKATGLGGNLCVSANVAMTFLLGGISAGLLASALLWVFALLAFCFDLAEEIAGDAMDMEGDRARGSRSIALVRGKPTALRLSAILFGVVILLSLVPLFLGENRPGYFVPILIMDLLIVFFTRLMLASQRPAEGVAAMRGLYISATLGLLAFLCTRFLG
jgi:geranylgeranylglycerol-phosphate geranylgeranyltransferase